MIAPPTGLLLGVLLGMRHALEPDHLAAVTTLATSGQGSRRAVLLGVSWGLGHTLALVAVGWTLVATGASLPGDLARGFELAVAAMLIGLGAAALVRALRHHRDHTHGVPHPHPHPHPHPPVIARRPLAVGLLHGLAGSGALAALVMTTLPSTAARLGYIGVFGLGSVAGMAALTGLAGWPLSRLARHRRAARAVSVCAGVLCMAVGAAWSLRQL